MAYLNDQPFENPVPLKRADILAAGAGDGSLCAENGYLDDLLFARHCPPDGIYWLGLNGWTRRDTEKHGHHGVRWALVRVTTGIAPLRCLRWLWGGDFAAEWYDFSQARWVGPVEMPAPPPEPPASWAQRL